VRGLHATVRNMDGLFGRNVEWTAFTEQRGVLINALERTDAVCVDMLVEAGKKTESDADKTILATAIACRHEFQEIVTLCAFGYGSGGNKLLRSFFERVVTLAYLAKHPQEILDFVDYTSVHWNKLLIEARENHEAVNLSEEEIARIEEDYARVRAQYIDRKTGRVRGSWTKKATPQIADDVDTNLRKLYFNAFLRPTFLTHTTYLGVTYTAEVKPEGGVHFFSPSKEREFALETIGLAHTLFMQAMLTLNIYYRLEADEIFKKNSAKTSVSDDGRHMRIVTRIGELRRIFREGESELLNAIRFAFEYSC
jgi:Family of unknown function (DUF5677)